MHDGKEEPEWKGAWVGSPPLGGPAGFPVLCTVSPRHPIPGQFSVPLLLAMLPATAAVSYPIAPIQHLLCAPVMVPAGRWLSVLEPPAQGTTCASGPKSSFSDIMLSACNRPAWKYLHHENQSMNTTHQSFPSP